MRSAGPAALDNHVCISSAISSAAGEAGLEPATSLVQSQAFCHLNYSPRSPLLCSHQAPFSGYSMTTI